MLTSTIRRSFVPFFIGSALILLLSGCEPRPPSVSDCLQEVQQTVGEAEAPRSFRFVKVCAAETRMRGYLPVALLVPADSTLRVDRLQLFLNGYALSGLLPSGLGPGKELKTDSAAVEVGTYRIVEFRLFRNQESREGWGHILGGERNWEDSLTLTVAAGWEGGPAFEPWGDGPDTILFRNHAWAYTSEVFWLLAGAWIVMFLLLAVHAKDGTGEKATFSLSRLTTLFWSFLIGGAFVLIWALTGEWNGTLTGQALLLLGLQGGTVAGALSIPGSKDRSAVTETRASRWPYQGFFRDILFDAQGNLVLHRVQMFTWHIILGVVFVQFTWDHLWMPEFDDTLIVLLGIGNGVYLGGKLREGPKRRILNAAAGPRALDLGDLIPPDQ